MKSLSVQLKSRAFDEERRQTCKYRMFKLHSPYRPAGDQPKAIEQLIKNLHGGQQHQTLLGVTGGGKTFVMANVIAALQRPVLVISHNKTLAAQLFQEFRDFFPENAVHYFVSYYDYYQPEAYLPAQDTYIEKDAGINDELDRLRHGATQAVLSRQDVIIVASVSCIYGLGSAREYEELAFKLKAGQKITQASVIARLVDLQYSRNQTVLERGTFRRKGEVLEIASIYANEVIMLVWNKGVLENIRRRPLHLADSLKKSLPDELQAGLSSFNKKTRSSESLARIRIWPAKHYITPKARLKVALENIRSELNEQVKSFNKRGKLLEAQRLQQRTEYDLDFLAQTGYCKGIENYSRHLSFRQAGQPPETLVDYFPNQFITFIDESHISLPQIRGMYQGDRARKQTLIEHGFRLPSALDNRPLRFEEFNQRINQVIYISATPAAYELSVSSQGRVKTVTDLQKKSKADKAAGIVELLIRPTGLLEPKVEVRSFENEIPDLLLELQKTVKTGGRALVTTVSKRLAEDVAEFLIEKGFKAMYLHSEIETLERPEILNDLRRGRFDVIVGINLLREGLDLPEVKLVAILDADKEGFLRNATTLIQTMGRAARHPKGYAILYASGITDSMRMAIDEINRRRAIQLKFNRRHKLAPRAIVKPLRPSIIPRKLTTTYDKITMPSDLPLQESIRFLTIKMNEAAQELDFEKAAILRDEIRRLKTEENGFTEIGKQ